MQYREALNEGCRRLTEAGISEAQVDAWLLFSECFGMDRTHYLLEQRTDIADEKKLAAYEEWLRRRALHEPVQYLIGTQDFYGLRFRVNENVLIPRLDTEVLVDTVIRERRAFGDCQSFLDLCTGSGCIAVSLLKCGPFAKGMATDLSEKALELARINAQENEASCLSFYAGDLWEAVPKDRKVDVIVSNPPYIAQAERTQLAQEVVLHEPELALFAPEEGLLFYRRIVEEAGDFLFCGGGLYLEIGCTQAKAVCEMLRSELVKKGHFENIHVVRDLAGLDRVVCAQWME